LTVSIFMFCVFLNSPSSSGPDPNPNPTETRRPGMEQTLDATSIITTLETVKPYSERWAEGNNHAAAPREPRATNDWVGREPDRVPGAGRKIPTPPTDAPTTSQCQAGDSRKALRPSDLGEAPSHNEAIQFIRTPPV
jgi:hypothetical protein